MCVFCACTSDFYKDLDLGPDFKIKPLTMNVNHGRTLYVGGLDEKVTTDVLLASFLPFGDLVDVQIPKDLESGKSRAFGFVEFDSAEDAAEAIDNMHESELLGRTITVNVAKAKKTTEGSRRAIWADDVWLLEHAGQTLDTKDNEHEGNSDNEHVTDENKET